MPSGVIQLLMMSCGAQSHVQDINVVACCGTNYRATSKPSREIILSGLCALQHVFDGAVRRSRCA